MILLNIYFIISLTEVVLLTGIRLITLDNEFQKLFCICDEYVINLFLCIYKVRKGT